MQVLSNFNVKMKTKTLELGKYRKARVWLDQLPTTIFSPELVTQVNLPIVGRIAHAVSMVAIELSIPVGPRAMYGLLGARFESKQAGDLVVRIGSTSSEGAILSDNIAINSDVVRTGLPHEYLNGVSKGIQLANLELARIGAGVLTINCAAYAKVSSCESVYTQVTRMLASLLSADDNNWSDEALIVILQSCLS